MGWIAMVMGSLLVGEEFCEAVGDCAAGCVSVLGVCCFVEELGHVLPEDMVVGVVGGESSGPDGVLLCIPAGALGGDTALRIARASATHVPVGCQEMSAFYLVTPEVDFATPATVSIPVADCSDCRVFERPPAEGPWTALAEPDITPTDTAAALLVNTGAVWVAGVPQ